MGLIYHDDGTGTLRVVLGVTAVLLAAASWLPWFRHTVASSGRQNLVFGASAWGASTVWSAAVAFGIVAGIAAALVGHRTGGKVLALVLAFAGLALCATEVVRILQLSSEPGTSVVVMESGYSEPDDFGIERDQLNLTALSGYSSDFAIGVWLGCVLLSIQVLLAAAALLASPTRRTDAGSPGLPD